MSETKCKHCGQVYPGTQGHTEEDFQVEDNLENCCGETAYTGYLVDQLPKGHPGDHSASYDWSELPQS